MTIGSIELVLALALGPGMPRSQLPDRSKARFGFVSKPVEMQTPEDRAFNNAFLEAEIARRGRPRLDVLVEFLTDGRHLYLVRPALVAMGAQAVPALRYIVGERSYAGAIRLEALKALDQIGDREAAHYAEPAIFPMPPVRLDPPGAMGGDVEPGPVEAEFQWLYLDIKLRGLNEAQKMAVLFDMLIDDQRGLLAATALKRIGTAAVPGLISALRDKDNPYRARFTAQQSLWLIGDKRAIPAMVEVLVGEAETDQIRCAAAAYLGQLGDPAAIPALERAAQSWRPKPGTDTVVYNLERDALDSIKRLRGGR